jgi:Tfp pilus assembly protein PilV
MALDRRHSSREPAPLLQAHGKTGNNTEDIKMKLTHSIKNSAGIGLIEVLVTTVVVAVGLLAVASLQGDLLSGSRGNKTRAEAQALANTKIEQLRDTIQKTGYDALASSSAAESIGGVTETFTRSWVVTNQTAPVRKQVSVTVCWSNGCPVATGNSQNQVTVQSVIAFDDVGNSGLTASGAGSGTGATVGGPSTNANSSDDISENIILSTSATPGSVTTVNGKTYIVQSTGTKGTRADLCNDAALALTAFENGLYTRRVNFDGVTGNETILLYEKVTISAVDYCIPRIRFNGGVIIPIRGIVHSGATSGGNNQTLLDVDLFTFNANESGTYCVFNPPEGAKSAPYVCYVGGNCQYGPAGTVTSPATEPPVTECPSPAVANAIVGPGGWRGKVGLLGVADNGKNVCFAEEIAATPATLDTARNYFVRKAGLNEGINKPYSCHDFLIINGQSTEAKVHNECAAQANAIGGFTLASKTIQRDITGNNVFSPDINVDYCEVSGTSYTITGTITNANSAPTVTVTDSVHINPCSATQTSYTCQIQTSATSVTISGVYNNERKTCTMSPSGSACALAFTATSNPTYTINGHINGTAAAANAVTLALSEGGTCVNNNDNNGTFSTYTCSITTPTATTSATLTATTSAVGGTVTPDTQTITLPGTAATLTGSDLTATVATTYTVSGTISIGNQVSLTTVTAAVDTGLGTCTLTGSHAQNTSDSYSCTVPAGANHLAITLSSACTSGNGSKKYEMTSSGATSSLGTGSLIIDLGNVTGNVTKNISVTKSSNNC